MKKSIIFLFVIAILIFPFSVLAEGEGEGNSTDVVEVKPLTEQVQQKYKELLLYACSESSSSIVATDGDDSTSSDETKVFDICKMITAENFDWNTIISDGVIYMPTSQTEKVPIRYDINEDNKNIHFSAEANVHNGMTKDEMNDELSKLMYGMYSLPIVAMMNGATPEEGLEYLGKCFIDILSSSLSEGLTASVIILPDDTDDATYTYDTENNPNTLVIRESEFPNKVIEYLELLYGDPTIDNGLYYLNGTAMEKLDNDNAKITTTYSVSYEMDLDVLRAYISESEEEEEEHVVDPTETVPTKTREDIIEEDTSKKSLDPTKDTGTIENPKTSTLISLVIIPVLVVVGYVLYSIKYKKRIFKA